MVIADFVINLVTAQIDCSVSIGTREGSCKGLPEFASSVSGFSRC